MKFFRQWWARIFLITCILLLTACTHLERPNQIISAPGTAKDWGTQAPCAKDRARHEIEGKKPFEWWYFDGHLDNGQVFVGVFQAPSFTTGKIEAIFSLYSADWTREDHIITLKPEDVEISKDDIHIETPAGFIRRIDDHTYHVRWAIDDIEAEFTLTTFAQGWIPVEENGKVNKPERDFFWAVHQGRNTIHGTITRNGKTEHVKGVGYADHNWGRKPLNEITKKWIWGRIIAKDYTIIYADVDYQEPDLVLNPLYIAKGDRMILGSGSPAIRQWDFETHPDLKRHYPRQVEISYDSKDVSVRIHMTKKRLVEEVDLVEIAGYRGVLNWLIRTFVARPSYFRIIADYEATITNGDCSDKISGECLYEVMGFE
ncbi:MAG: hypothetical protein M0Z56_02865 [Desulfobacteraceae bacterium]|nr:hypothetical protein [Desulfobacteraceae bacterium]